jgi:hypothetical protein
MNEHRRLSALLKYLLPGYQAPLERDIRLPAGSNGTGQPRGDIHEKGTPEPRTRGSEWQDKIDAKIEAAREIMREEELNRQVRFLMNQRRTIRR